MVRIAQSQASPSTDPKPAPHKWRHPAIISVLTLTVAALAACGASPSSGGTSSTPATFYKGKTVELLVPNAPGGNIDVTARLTAPYLQKYLGAAAVKVVDVTGAGGVVGLDQLWNTPKNGLTVGYTNVPVSLLTGIVGGSGITYIPGKFIYLGRLTAEPRLVVVSAKSPIKSVAQLVGQKVKIPTTGFDDSFYAIAALGHSIGFTPQYVTGFADLAAATASLATGATTLEEGDLSSLGPAIKSGLVRPLLIETSGPKPSGFQNLPQWTSVATRDSGLVQAFTSLVSIEGSYFVPPGTPPTAVTALRAAIAKMAADHSFQTRATKAGTQLDYMSGAAEEAAVHKLLAEVAPYTSALRAEKASVAG